MKHKKQGAGIRRQKSGVVEGVYGLAFVNWLSRLRFNTDNRAPTTDSDSDYLEEISALAEELPTLSMDWTALANHLEAALGQAAMAGALESGQKPGIRSQGAEARSQFSLLMFAAEITNLPSEIAFAPLAKAVAKLDSRTPIAAKLTSAQWSRVALDLRERAFFSARVANIRFLAEAQSLLHKRISMEKESLANGKSAYIDRGVFIMEMRRIAQEEGIDTTDNPSQRGSIRDIHSAKRLGLIYDMQTTMAQEYARWNMDHDADVLDAYPAQRFERIESRVAPRPVGFWEARWAEAGQNSGWAGALERPMVALKTSPIWQGLSIFGTPWPPFDWGSGWGLVDVDREESDALGLTRPALPVPEFDNGSGRTINGDTGKLSGFNDVLEASVERLEPHWISKLMNDFGDKVELSGGKIKWLGSEV